MSTPQQEIDRDYLNKLHIPVVFSQNNAVFYFFNRDIFGQRIKRLVFFFRSEKCLKLRHLMRFYIKMKAAPAFGRFILARTLDAGW